MGTTEVETPVTPVTNEIAAPVVTNETKIVPPAKDSSSSGKEPDWLASRLERERQAIVSQFGFKNVDEAKSAFEELKTRRDKDKTETERLASENAALQAQVSKAKELETIVKAHTDAALNALTPTQRETVIGLVGDDPSKVISTIERLRGAGMLTPLTAPSKPPAANTAPPNTAPSDTSNGAPSRLREYEQLKAKNPVQAAAYRITYQTEIHAEKQGRS